MIRRPPRSTLFPYTTLFRSVREGPPMKGVHPVRLDVVNRLRGAADAGDDCHPMRLHPELGEGHLDRPEDAEVDRKSTRLNSSHSQISYAVFCLKKKTHDRTS